MTCKDFGIKNVREYHDLYLSEWSCFMLGTGGVFESQKHRAKKFDTQR